MITPQQYVYACTEKSYSLKMEDPVREIYDILIFSGIYDVTGNNLANYPLDQICDIVKHPETLNGLVLVDVSYYNPVGEYIVDHRWFDVPETFKTYLIDK